MGVEGHRECVGDHGEKVCGLPEREVVGVETGQVGGDALIEGRVNSVRLVDPLDQRPAIELEMKTLRRSRSLEVRYFPRGVGRLLIERVGLAGDRRVCEFLDMLSDLRIGGVELTRMLEGGTACGAVTFVARLGGNLNQHS